MEAGLEHLSIGTLEHIDLLLVVVQPTYKTMLTADRTCDLARQLGIAEVAFVANRVRRDADVEQLRAFAARHHADLVATIPEDEAVRRADAEARCVLDVAPGSPVVDALGRLADTLEDRLAAAGTAR